MSVSQTGRWRGQRAMSTPIGMVVMVVVILVMGAIGYVALNKSTTGGGTTSVNPNPIVTCTPPTAPICGGASNVHDFSLSAPFKTVQQGNPVPFTAVVPNSDTVSSVTYTFGDGSNLTTSSLAVSHTYASPGTFFVSVTGKVGSTTHDSYRSLVALSVAASYASSSGGDVPGVTGAITSNSSVVSGVPPTAVLVPGGSATFAGSYTGAPTNPAFSLSPPNLIVSSGGVLSNTAPANASYSATATFANPGTYVVTFVGISVGQGTPAPKAYQNFTWTVFVAPAGFHAGVAGTTAISSPHKGSLVVYEDAPGGALTEDPAIDYETVGYEPILNVYQSLIAYNGSLSGPSPQDFVPVLATCVPGSAQCQSLYGNTLVSTDGNNYTFVISSSARFYDPSNAGNSWGVYPTDVVFSMARDIGFSTLPCFGCNNGWILAQALVSTGSSSWDGGTHSLLNNTPGNIMSAMTINDSSCPAAAMTNDHGCVTFHANADNQAWPYFLELVATASGGAVVSCGWYSATSGGNAGIPDWTLGNSSGNGDHPCGVMGSSGWGVDPATLSGSKATAWDNWELTSSGVSGYVGNVQWGMVGSGPYYAKNIAPGSSYTLAANPNYVQNPHCTWTGCEPAKGAYAGSVSVVWETSAIPGEQAYASGVSDFASIPSTDTALLL
ncbi:MAG: PKD domain-containing protein, partial [Thermoplasmata archaeon]|nr:PKD domain-containing protein [Thermoplasmata archaeon]